jgi:hypothetical protein
MKMVNKQGCANLSMCHLGLALGVTYGMCFLALAYVSMFSDMFMPATKLLASMLPGYRTTLVGGLVGFGWGFAKGLVTGWMIAVSYNFFNKVCCKPCDTKNCKK